MGSRAANNESSIHQDDTGRWHGYVSMGLKEGGRRDRRHVTATSRREVVAKVRALETKRDAGTALAAGTPPTVGVWMGEYLDNVAARRVRPSTLERYRSLSRVHIVPRIGHHRLDRLQPEHVERLYTDMAAAGLAPASVLQAHRLLSRALKIAMQRGRIARNVCTLVDAPSVTQHEIEPLSVAEARAILETAKTRRNGTRWAIALALGLRQGEALGLQWRDLDLDAPTLTVRRALQRQRGQGLVLVEPKSRAGRRTITLPEPVVELLRAHRVAQNTERLHAGSEWHALDYVFAQLTGLPLDSRADRRDWDQLLQDAGVRPARLHDARHTAATTLLLMGVPARVVMQILGHSQIGLTLGTYSHVVPELATDAANKMSAAYWS
ncbi:MAG: tyrosine-type recombinase/integrase [Frankiales bacterium]|nr:tyrosine-type recombinase/integrase [Frankiales bacterium]